MTQQSLTLRTSPGPRVRFSSGMGRSVIPFLAAVVLTCVGNVAAADAVGATADWSTYRGDHGRTGYADVALAYPLQLLWTYEPAHPPQPAWPPPARGSYWQELSTIEPRVVDDQTFHPVIVGDAVFFASSADDQVYCLDSATGSVRWTYVTDGPLRYAPVVTDDRVYFGGDDGQVYCIDARDGALVWRRRLGPIDRRIPGNGRLISAWPIRAGILVDDGVLFACAGLYPNQGVFAYALKADDGEVLWQQSLSQSPQGYLLASENQLYVTTGRSNPFSLDRKTGKAGGGFDGIGGTYAVVTENELVAGPGNDGSLEVSDISSKQHLIRFEGSQMVVTPRDSYLLGRGQLLAVDRLRFMKLTRKLNAHEAERTRLKKQLEQLENSGTQSEQLTTVREDLLRVARDIDELQKQRNTCYRWTVETEAEDALVACSSAVITGNDGMVTMFSAETGETVWQHELSGAALGMAVTSDRLIVTTDEGVVYCFAPASSTATATPSETSQQKTETTPQMSPAVAELAKKLLSKAAMSKGFCLILGVKDGRLAYEIARQSELQVVAVTPDEDLSRKVRKDLIDWGVYGRRVTIHHVDSDTLPMTDFFANIVTTELPNRDPKSMPWSPVEVERVLRPFGGVAWFPGDAEPEVRGPLPGAGEWTHQYADSANTANSGDRHIHRQLQLQWFGGPGPQQMVDRHLRAPAPLCASGYLIVPGENSLIGVDAYNGTVLWQLDMPGTQRYSMPYDAGYMAARASEVFVATKDGCQVIDIATGDLRRTVPMPSTKDATADWGYVGLHEGQLFGSSQKPTASRSAPSRGRIDADYNNEQPVVTSNAVFCVDPSDGRTNWVYEDGVIINPTITVAGDSVYFVESCNAEARANPTGRMPLSEMLASEAYVVALDGRTGSIRWRNPIDEVLQQCRNILYLQFAEGRIIASGSYPRDNDSWYQLAVIDAATGQPQWTASHARGKPNAFTHGEQVHHPVILGDRIVAEPFIYDFDSGERVSPNESEPEWRINRPGHSCGTMSGASDCVFFRANNPTLLDLQPATHLSDRFLKLAPSRPGCWINIIPAAGMVLIPEASASCVCHYSLQTSMAFLPVKTESEASPSEADESPESPSRENADR